MLTLISTILLCQTTTRMVPSISPDVLPAQTPNKPFEATVPSTTPVNQAISIQLPGAGSLDGVKGYYKLYIDLPDKPGRFDTMLVYARGVAFPLNGGTVQPGTAVLVDTYSFVKIEDATVTLNTNQTQLTLNCPKLGTPGATATLLGAHFLPSSYNVTGFQHGMGHFETDFIWSGVPRSGMFLPPSWRYSTGTMQVSGGIINP